MQRTRRRRLGFSLMELLIVVAIILVILAIAVPKYNQTSMHAREMAAIKHVQTIHNSQVQYYSQFGRFATSLNELGPPASGQEGPAGANLLPSDLASGNKGDYLFVLQTSQGGYTINANPAVYQSSGRRAFYSDQSLVIRENWGQEPATATSKELGSTR